MARQKQGHFHRLPGERRERAITCMCTALESERHACSGSGWFQTGGGVYSGKGFLDLVQTTNKTPKPFRLNQVSFLNTNATLLPQSFPVSVGLLLVLCTQEGSHCLWEVVIREQNALPNPVSLPQKEVLTTHGESGFVTSQTACAQRFCERTRYSSVLHCQQTSRHYLKSFHRAGEMAQ